MTRSPDAKRSTSLVQHEGGAGTPAPEDARGASPRGDPLAGVGGRAVSGVVRRLLGLPLFYKVLIANSAIVVIGALAGTFITARVAEARQPAGLDVPLACAFALVGIALTVFVNALVLRAAFAPLTRLKEVARRIQEGDFSVRAQPSPLADAEVARFAETLNAILDDVQRYQ